VSSLADLMLPDGAHLRAEDWTTFYLRLPVAQDGNEATGEEGSGSLPRESLEGVPVDRDNAEGTLLFVINLVRTKKDETVKR
jgi:hypothetical protein